MRATTTFVLLFLVPCLGACDYHLGDLPDPDEEEGAQCAPDAGSGPPPVLTLVGPAIQSHECATAYTDPGAMASDVCFGDLSSSITRAGEVYTHAPGSYPLTYNVSNPAGQSATPVTRTVNVQDTQPPVVTPSGPLDVALECGSTYTDPGATASDGCAGALPAVPTSLPDPNTPGSYSLRYQATDPSGNVAVSSESRTVTVADTLAPALALVGPINATHECGSTYVDPGATASDLCAGDLTGAVVATQTGNPNAPGTMTVNYSVTDPAGHTTVAAQPRVVNVTDTLPPVLALVGSASQVQECAQPYTDPGATAMDGCFGDVSSRITRAGTVNTSVLGSYSLTYSVTDPAGQSATPVNRAVNVQDTLPPLISIVGPSNMALECGSAYTDPGATASDACAGALPAVPTGAPDSRTPGSYSLRYQATDPSGNTATSTTARTVVVADTLPPSVTVNGPLNMTHECGPDYVDPGATAADICAGDLTGAVVTTRTGSPNVPGTMTVNYSVTDPAGHTTTAPQQRVVDVTDNLPPVLTLLGGSTQVQECAFPYADPGAAAMDQCFGDLSGSIRVTGTVDPNVLGSYFLTYNVSDPAGHSVTRTRTVNVRDTMPPVVTPVGPLIMALECGSMWTDPGATAFDECAGDLPAVPTGAPDPSTPGDYIFRYQATDPSGNTGTSSAHRTVGVSDTVPPTIVVNGPLDDSLECGESYVDPGATATDVCAGPVAVWSTRVGSSTSPGQFTLFYTAADPSGNAITSAVVRTVHVNDNQPPTLALVGPATQVQECALPYTDPGATAMDACFGDLSGSITRVGTVDTSVLGSSFLTYNVTDPAGHSATPVTRTVNVQDSLPPMGFILNGAASIVMECGDTWTDPGATASDACAGELPAVPTGAPDPGTVGNYSFGYRATDPSGNTATSGALRTVMVRDTEVPILVVNGPLDQQIECGSTPYEDPGATATDVCAGPVEVSGTRSGSVATNTPGTYALNITYSATDPSGNTATSQVIRTVQVFDTLGPELQVLPGPSVIECNGPPYVDPGATAFDQCAGDLTQAINVTGSVDHTRSGDYTITYDVTDPAGHTNVANRTVTVGPCPICFSLALSDDNLLLLEDSGAIHSVEGRVEAGGERAASRFVELRVLSSRLSRLAAQGETRREGREGLSLKGTDPELNVFEVEAQALTQETQLSIDAPAGSLVVLNIRGDAVVLEGLQSTFSGGIDSQDVLYNFVDATSIHAERAKLEGSVLAPYARIDFNDGSWKGGLYAVSLTGNAQGYLSPLRDRTVCP